MRKFRLTFLTLLLCTSVFAQQRNFWTQVNESTVRKDLFAASQTTRPSAYKIFELNETAFKLGMSQAPHENTVAAKNSSFIVSFPNADGQLEDFRVVEAPSMHPALAARYPGITAYAGRGITDPTATIRFDLSPQGTHVTIMSTKPTVYIDKLDDNYYRVASRTVLTDRPAVFNCQTEEIANTPTSPTAREQNADDGILRKYRLALLAGGEFSQFYLNGTETTDAQRKAKVLAAQNAHVTRANALYERDLAIRMELVPTNDAIIFLDPATDPLDSRNGPSQIPLQNAIDAAIGSGNYDIGHTESRSNSNGNSNGNAGCIACVCKPWNGDPDEVDFEGKGGAFTSYFNLNMLDLYVIDFLTHEMGHQFGATHTFSHAYEGTGTQMEPGSATTIMGYAGITGPPDVQPHSDDYFHAVSIQQITQYIRSATGSACAVTSPTGNTSPTVNAGANFIIPKSTPFKLTASATDPNADVMSYCWEQMNSRPGGGWSTFPQADATAGPQFRSYLPTTSTIRNFPILASILDGSNGNTWEALPSVDRTLNFRLTVRDNHMGNESANMIVTVNSATGPFLVTAPATGVTWNVGSSQTVTWSVNGTTGAPINCANVNIVLSTDGGQTFPVTLVANTPNDGTETFTVPNAPSSTCRVKVESVGNIFFDIDNVDFTIPAPPTGFEFNTPAAASITCAGPNTSDITLATTSTGGFSTPIVLSVTSVLPPGTTVSFNPVSGTIAPGNSAVVTLNGVSSLPAGNYNVTITGTAGTTIRTRVLTYTVQPGAGPTINTPPGAQTVCANTNAIFTVAATGSSLTYLWQVSTDGGANYNAAPGTNNTSTYTITGATTVMNNNRYRVIVTGQCGATTSSAAILTVRALPAIGTSPGNATVCVNTNATFTVTASGDGITYLWQVSTDNGANYNTAPGTNNLSTYTVNSVTTTMSGNRYRVVVTGTCAPPATSSHGLLTVVTPTTVTDPPDNITICETGTVTFTVAASSTATINYGWEVSTNGGGSYTPVTNGGVYSGATTPTLTVTGIPASLNGNLYRAVVSNATCTAPVPSTAATLTVNARPTVTLAASPGTALLPGQSTTLTATILPSAAGFDIIWFKNGTPIPGVTGTTYVVDSVAVGDYKVRIENQTTHCNNESAVLSITAASSERLFIYPSPNTGRFTVSYFNSNGGGPVKQTITVYDDHGALVYTKAVTVQGPYTLNTVDLSGASSGVYLVVVGDANGKRLAKEKVFIYH